jgi:hypothetical protein
MCRLLARFDEDEVYAPQRNKPPRFTESGLAVHSRAEHSTAEKCLPSETSQKDELQADHRTFIRASINNGWRSWMSITASSENSPNLRQRLHPRFGISWPELGSLRSNWVRDAKVGIKDYFVRWYDTSQGEDEETTQYDATPRTMGQDDDQYTHWINSKTKKTFTTGSNLGELERYLRLEPQDTQDPIRWRKRPQWVVSFT